MGDDKLEQPGPEEGRHAKKDDADTEGHRKKVASLTEEPGVGPDEGKKMPLAIPDDSEDTEGHKR